MGYGTNIFQEFFLGQREPYWSPTTIRGSRSHTPDVTLKLHLRSCITSSLGHWLRPLLQPLVESFPLGPHAEHMVSPSS